MRGAPPPAFVLYAAVAGQCWLWLLRAPDPRSAPCPPSRSSSRARGCRPAARRPRAFQTRGGTRAAHGRMAAGPRPMLLAIDTCAVTRTAVSTWRLLSETVTRAWAASSAEAHGRACSEDGRAPHLETRGRGHGARARRQALDLSPHVFQLGLPNGGSRSGPGKLRKCVPQHGFDTLNCTTYGMWCSSACACPVR